MNDDRIVEDLITICAKYNIGADRLRELVNKSDPSKAVEKLLKHFGLEATDEFMTGHTYKQLFQHCLVSEKAYPGLAGNFIVLQVINKPYGMALRDYLKSILEGKEPANRFEWVGGTYGTDTDNLVDYICDLYGFPSMDYMSNSNLRYGQAVEYLVTRINGNFDKNLLIEEEYGFKEFIKQFDKPENISWASFFKERLNDARES